MVIPGGQSDGRTAYPWLLNAAPARERDRDVRDRANIVAVVAVNVYRRTGGQSRFDLRL